MLWIDRNLTFPGPSSIFKPNSADFTICENDSFQIFEKALCLNLVIKDNSLVNAYKCVQGGEKYVSIHSVSNAVQSSRPFCKTIIYAKESLWTL
jgi:hypothetical protein